MSKKSFTSVYVKKVAPKFHKVLGYLTNKLPDESILSVFNKLKLKPVDIASLECGKAVSITGNYDWNNHFLLGKEDKTLFHYQISLFTQRMKFMRTMCLSENERISSIIKHPPLLLLSIPYPSDELTFNNNAHYLRGILPGTPPIYVFAPIYPNIKGSVNKLKCDIDRLSQMLRLDRHSLVKLLVNMPKFLVAINPGGNVFNVDLMTMPQPYDVSSQTVKIFPPIYSHRINVNFGGPTSKLETRNHMNDFCGLEKYTRVYRSNDGVVVPFEELLCMDKYEDPDGGVTEDLSLFLMDSFKTRKECKIYGVEFNKKLPVRRFLKPEIQEHALKETALYKETVSQLKKSIYSTNNTTRLIRKIVVNRRKPTKV